MSDYVTLDISILDELLDQADEIADLAAIAGGAAILEESINQIQVMRAIDTGALRNSGYLITTKSDGRGDAIKAAKNAASGGKKKGKRRILIAGDGTRTVKNGEAVIAFAVEHAAYVEMGSPHMGARPFLETSVQIIEKEMPTIVGRILEDKAK